MLFITYTVFLHLYIMVFIFKALLQVLKVTSQVKNNNIKQLERLR